VTEAGEWLDRFVSADFFCYIKRLSGNDTLANRSHQAGPYIPRDVLFAAFPVLNRPDVLNPDVWFQVSVDSHANRRDVRAIWYNTRLHGRGTRNEARVTNFGGIASALLDPDNTGALTVFAFAQTPAAGAAACHVWICRNQVEEDLVEDRVGPVDPGEWTVWTAAESPAPRHSPVPRTTCRLTPSEIPPAWLQTFPSGEEIIRKTVELRADHHLRPDERILRRRDCEYEIFRSVEEAFELPSIAQGFQGIDQFVARAQTILQRRKARSGRSLELHLRQVFVDEGLMAGSHFDHQPESESGKRPDFLFPSAASYRDPAFSADRLRMLAVKTTCKDRWRQILNEADRVPRKHLLTLQEGISENQFREMTVAGVQLVVPAPLRPKFPDSVQAHLQDLEGFIAEVRTLSSAG
jgi:hypothetical protein